MNVQKQKQSNQAVDLQQNLFLKLVYSPQIEHCWPPPQLLPFLSSTPHRTPNHNATFFFFYQWKPVEG